jgi:hypothetical protein
MKKPPAWGGSCEAGQLLHYRVVQVFDRPKLIDHACGHCRGHADAAVNPNEVVVGDVRRHRCCEVFQLFEKPSDSG